MESYSKLVAEAAEKYAKDWQYKSMAMGCFAGVLQSPEAKQLIEQIAREAYSRGYDFGYAAKRSRLDLSLGDDKFEDDWSKFMGEE